MAPGHFAFCLVYLYFRLNKTTTKEQTRNKICAGVRKRSIPILVPLLAIPPICGGSVLCTFKSAAQRKQTQSCEHAVHLNLIPSLFVYFPALLWIGQET